MWQKALIKKSLRWPISIGKEIWTLCEPPHTAITICAKTKDKLPPMRCVTVAITADTITGVVMPIENLELLNEFSENVKFVTLEEFLSNHET